MAFGHHVTHVTSTIKNFCQNFLCWNHWNNNKWTWTEWSKGYLACSGFIPTSNHMATIPKKISVHGTLKVRHNPTLEYYHRKAKMIIQNQQFIHNKSICLKVSTDTLLVVLFLVLYRCIKYKNNSYYEKYCTLIYKIK